MTLLRLTRYEAEKGALPTGCMQCGAPATHREKTTFYWRPGTAAVLHLFGFLPYAIGSLLLTKRMSVCMPLCRQHRRRPVRRGMVLVVSLLGVMLLLYGVGSLVPDLYQQVAGTGDPTGAILALCAIFALVLIAWVILVMRVVVPAIRSKEITDERIVLTGVCSAFIEALQAHRRGPG